jgi:squalene synthase HpnC
VTAASSGSWNFARELSLWNPLYLDRAKPPGLSQARAYCAYVARTHYENFSLITLLLPRRLIKHFQAVYAYCRWSDDLADETSGGAEALALLDAWEAELLACHGGREPVHPVMVALRETIRRFAIPPEPFLRLLTAFRQDQHLQSYSTFEQLLGYCRNSADPVGHLVLYLFECFDTARAALADQVCTGLQLANFWQDVARDLDIGRVYLPAEDRARFGYDQADLLARRCTPAFRELMKFEVERTHGYFDRGEALLPLLPREARVDIDLFIAGGRATLGAIEKQDYDVWSNRPEVTKRKKLVLFLLALRHLLGPARTMIPANSRSGP